MRRIIEKAKEIARKIMGGGEVEVELKPKEQRYPGKYGVICVYCEKICHPKPTPCATCNHLWRRLVERTWRERMKETKKKKKMIKTR